jgi:BolA protein
MDLMKQISDFVSELKERIDSEFQPISLKIIDFSAEHAGHVHGGAAQSNRSATHLEIQLQSARFEGLSRLQRERLVQGLLAAELQSGRIHALVLKLKSPLEVF